MARRVDGFLADVCKENTKLSDIFRVVFHSTHVNCTSMFEVGCTVRAQDKKGMNGFRSNSLLKGFPEMRTGERTLRMHSVIELHWAFSHLLAVTFVPSTVVTTEIHLAHHPPQASKKSSQEDRRPCASGL